MIEELLKQDRELIRARINSETAKMPWRDLQRFFAAGKVMWTASELDLVEVACAIQEDDVNQVRNWTESGKLAGVTNDQARQWFETDSSLWTVVIKPWLLVQELTD